MIDKPFIYLETHRGRLIINLLQVVSVDNLTGTTCRLRMSDGREFNLEDGPAEQIIMRLAGLTVTGSGQALVEYIVAKSETSPASQTEGEASAE